MHDQHVCFRRQKLSLVNNTKADISNGYFKGLIWAWSSPTRLTIHSTVFAKRRVAPSGQHRDCRQATMIHQKIRKFHVKILNAPMYLSSLEDLFHQSTQLQCHE